MRAAPSQQGLDPRRDRLLQRDQPAALEDAGQAIRSSQVVIVEDQDVREGGDGFGEIRLRPGKTARKFVGRNVMPALGYPHGNALLRHPGSRDADKAEDYGVTGGGRVCEEADLIAYGIGKDRLEDEALPPRDERSAQRVGAARRRLAQLRTLRGPTRVRCCPPR